MKAKQIKGYLNPKLKEDFDTKVQKQYGEGNNTTKVLRKLILKYVNGEIDLK